MKIERLIKLAKHLKTGKLGHEKFNYNWFNYNAPEPNMCGTMGCALGEMPIIDRRNWKFDGNGVTLRKDGSYSTVSAAKYFGITQAESYYLFMPRYSRPFGYDESCLPEFSPKASATKDEVADHILNFVAAKIKRLEV